MPDHQIQMGADQARQAGMRRPSLSFSTIRPFLIIFLSIGLAGLLAVRADNPSPVGWNLSGGGFCDGAYTIFNTTLSPNPGIYGQSCATGKNDCFSATDFGAVVNCAVGLMNGGMIQVRPGFFAQTTAVTMSNSGCTGTGAFFCGGYWLKGSGDGGCIAYGASPYTCSANATQIVAKAVITNMIQGTANPTFSSSGAGSPMISHEKVSDLTLISNGKAINGINFAHNEGGANGNIVQNVQFTASFIQNAACPGGFSTGLIMDGSEDSWVDQVTFNGGGGTPCSDTVDLQWLNPLGNDIITNSLFGGVLNLIAQAQTVSFEHGTISSVKLGAQTCSNCGVVFAFTDSYLANAQNTCFFNVNGFTQKLIVDFRGNTIGTPNAGSLYCGTGTVNNALFSGNFWSFGTGTNWNSGGATLTKQVTDGSNAVRIGNVNCAAGACYTNFPFTIDANGNF